MTIFISGWADIDEANKQSRHYMRRPIVINKARATFDNVWREEIQTINDWEDGLVDYAAVEAIRAKREKAEYQVERAYNFWDKLAKQAKDTTLPNGRRQI